VAPYLWLLLLQAAQAAVGLYPLAVAVRVREHRVLCCCRLGLHQVETLDPFQFRLVSRKAVLALRRKCLLEDLEKALEGLLLVMLDRAAMVATSL
jgi:hypothetical protein